MHSYDNAMSGIGACILGCEGTAVKPEERRFFQDVNPLGFILFSRNIEEPDAVRRLADDLRSAAGRNALVLIDQEGGRVQRLRGPHWREWPPPLEQCEMLPPDKAAEAMALRYEIIGSELRALGIDTNCVPTADTASGQTHPVLLNRCYSRDPGQVATLARAVADGCFRGGVLPVVKHIPGHGRPSSDSHLELPETGAKKEELAETDFKPFRALRDLPIGMTGHVVYSAIDPDSPATQSSKAIGIVRDEIGFDGLLMTDDISMNALSGGVRERARRSLDAGCDLVLHCNGKMSEMAEAAEEAGTLSGASASRASRALDARPASAPDGPRVVEAIREFESIMEGKPVPCPTA